MGGLFSLKKAEGKLKTKARGKSAEERGEPNTPSKEGRIKEGSKTLKVFPIGGALRKKDSAIKKGKGGRGGF